MGRSTQNAHEGNARKPAVDSETMARNSGSTGALLRLAGERLDPLALIALSLAILAGLDGAVPVVASAFLAGILLGARARLLAGAALVFGALVVLARWPVGAIWPQIIPLITVILAVLGVMKGRLRIGLGVATAALLAGVGVLIAMERIDSLPFAVLLATGSLLASVPGAYFGALIATSSRRQSAWERANIRNTARDLLLGRITTGMLHDLAQPINVVSMANGNLSYILASGEAVGDQLPLMQERIERIAGQTDKAAHLLQYFRSFGRDASGPSDMLSIRDALERARTATMSNVRHGGVEVTFRGDALDCVSPAGMDVLQVIAAGALLSAYASFIEETGEKRDGTVVIDAKLDRAAFRFTVSSQDSEGAVLPLDIADPVLEWLFVELLADAGGGFAKTRIDGFNAALSFELPR